MLIYRLLCLFVLWLGWPKVPQLSQPMLPTMVFMLPTLVTL